jgi:hypothetical protein
VSDSKHLLFIRGVGKITATMDLDKDAQVIWETWTQHHCGVKGKAPVLTMQRLEIISTAIISYGFSDCVNAIIGCKESEWHMGSNPRGKKYNSLELILRVSKKPEEQAKNQKRIDSFVRQALNKIDGDV